MTSSVTDHSHPQGRAAASSSSRVQPQVPDAAATQFNALSNPGRAGFQAEALIFAHLKGSPVVRSSEFSPVDGAIFLDWSEQDALPELWSERIDKAVTEGGGGRACCVNFDVKTRNLRAYGEGRIHWKVNDPTPSQRSSCAFIIVVFSAAIGRARDWVAVVPTRLFDGLVCNSMVTNNSVFYQTAVDPALAPYALPIDWLPEAIRGVASAAKCKHLYRNPWTGVLVPGWIPQLSTHDEVTGGVRTPLEMAKSSARGVAWFRKALHRHGGGIRWEINDVQPLLGDFILLEPDGQQHLFEHKTGQFFETEDRVYFKLLHDEIRMKRNPFYPLRLWDFIFWQSFDNAVAYCIPRNMVPDRFCTENHTSISTDLSSFRPWRLALDQHGAWVSEMFRRIVHPHREEPKLRRDLLPAMLRELDVEARFEMAMRDMRGRREAKSHDNAEPETAVPEGTSKMRTTRGYGCFGMICLLQDLCALRGQGVILPLWRHCPAGDFALCRWHWTAQEKETYWHSRELPVDLMDRRVRAESLLCIPIVTCVGYTNLDGGAIVTPAVNDSHRTGDQRDEYFLTRSRPFVLLVDPSPEKLSCGPGNIPHPYLMVASEHLQRPAIKDFGRAHPLRHWLPDACDPFEFALPLAKIQSVLAAMISDEGGEASFAYCRRMPNIEATPYKQFLSEVWQAHAQTAEDDALLARAAGHNRNAQPLKPAQRDASR